MTMNRERPVRDRSVEFCLGAGFAAVGALMLTSLAVVGPEFAPRYLREAGYLIVTLYSMLALGGGALVMSGLWWQYHRDPLIGRWEEAVGCLFIATVCVTYAYDLALGGFSSPSNALLLALLGGVASGFLVRMVVQIRKNFQYVRLVKRVVESSSSGLD